MPLQPTPNPTVDEILDNEPLVNGDVALAAGELVARLRALLPATITKKNARKGWTAPPHMITVPKASDIDIAPLDLTQVTRNCVLVAAAVETTPQGVGAFKNIIRVRVWSIEGRATTSEQIQNHFRRAETIRAVLLPFLRGCVTQSGEKAWRLLEPNGISILPERKEFSGVAATFTLVQSP